jgi:hypothetical protein
VVHKITWCELTTNFLFRNKSMFICKTATVGEMMSFPNANKNIPARINYLSGKIFTHRPILSDSTRHASAAVNGTCPFPMALSRSTRCGTPRATRGTSAGSDAQNPSIRSASPSATPPRSGSVGPRLPSANSPRRPSRCIPGRQSRPISSASETAPPHPSASFPSASRSPSSIPPIHSRSHPRRSGWEASIQMRFRRWGAPTSSAPSTHHSASNPISARSPRTRPSPREVSIGEFSTKT